jgi:hypothetical protein
MGVEMGKLRLRDNALAMTVLVVVSFIAYGIVLFLVAVVAPMVGLYYLVSRFGWPWYVGALIGLVYVIWLNDRLEWLSPERPAPREKHMDAAHTAEKSPGLFMLMLAAGLSLLRYFIVLAAVLILLPLWGWLRRWWDWPSAVEVPVAAVVCVLAFVSGLVLVSVVAKVQMAFAMRLYPNDPARRRSLLRRDG